MSLVCLSKIESRAIIRAFNKNSELNDADWLNIEQIIGYSEADTMEKKKDEIYNKISDSLEERAGSDRRGDLAVAEYINDELDRRKEVRRESSKSE